MVPRPLLFPALLCTALAASTASAQEGDALIDRGVALREQGRDADALTVFREAWDRDPTPRALAQIALAEQALGRWVDAEDHLTEALANREDPWIRSVRDVLETALRDVRLHIGQLEVRANVEGATVRIDGREVATLPSAPVSVPAGPGEMAVEAEGHRSVRRTVRIAAGQLTRESVELVPLEVLAGASSEPTDGSALRTVALVGAGVLAVGGIASLIWWIDRQSELDACRAGSCSNEDVLATTRDVAAIVTVTALAAAALGVTLALVLDDGDEEPALACGPLGCVAGF